MTFKNWLQYHAELVARPGKRQQEYQTTSPDEIDDEIDGIKFGPKKGFFQVPYFIIFISIAQILAFLCHTIFLKKFQCIDVGPTGPAPLCSVLIYNPYRRVEVWRHFTYLFVHSGYVHIISNIFAQVLLGSFLEIYHGSAAVALVYICGGVTGSLLTSVTDRTTYLAGASAGSYAIILAHIPFMILNFKEMKTIVEWIVCLLVPFTALVDIAIVIYNWNNGSLDSNTGYVAHLGGAIAGILVGMSVLKNLETRPWEKVLTITCIVVWTLIIETTILFNAFGGSSFYPPSESGDIEVCFTNNGQTCPIN